jgi:hypothetical protein
MQVIVGTRLLDKSSARALHRMGIVETQNPSIAGIVQRQFISNAVGTCLVWLNCPGSDLDPVPSSDPDVRSVEFKKNG